MKESQQADLVLQKKSPLSLEQNVFLYVSFWALNILLTEISYSPFRRVEAHDADAMKSIQAQFNEGLCYCSGFLKILLVSPVSAPISSNLVIHIQMQFYYYKQDTNNSETNVNVM